jgi:hypothetical protein
MIGTKLKELKKCPHPDPLPSDGRGNGRRMLVLSCSRVLLTTPLDHSRRQHIISLSHRMGEGRGEGFLYSL